MKNYLLIFIISMFFVQQYNLYAGVRDINGTVTPQYVAVHQVFPKGISLANGFVRFNAGLTITSTATAQLDTFFTVSAGMDIRNTGTLDLLSDLYLSSNFTFSTYGTIGGFIKGRGNTIHFGGNVKLQEGKTLQFIGDTIIDGGGNIFDLDSFSQLLVDHKVTLTLKNMEFRNKHNTVGLPSIRLISPSSKLALQNVKFSLADEFAFREGQLFIHNDVMVTGTSIFSYRSARHSYIDRNSSLLFDKGSTYFHYPATEFNDQWHMKDVSSVMAFDNASLFTTHTGMKLTRGTLFFDNGITVSSYAAFPNKIDSLSFLGSPTVNLNTNTPIVEWSHNQKFIAVKGENRIVIFNVNQSSLTPKFEFADNDFLIIRKIAWSNDDRYLLVTGVATSSTGGRVKIYSFDGLSIIPVAQHTIVTTSDFIGGIWSHDNRYIIISSEDKYAIYLFDGSSLSLVTHVADTDITFISGIAITQDNGYVAMSGQNASFFGVLKIFSFNAGILTPITVLIHPQPFYKNLWSFDNKYLFVQGSFSSLLVYNFNGSTLTQIISTPISQNSIHLAPDGRNILVTNSFPVRIWEFTGSDFISVAEFGSGPTLHQDAAWSPDGNFIFIITRLAGVTGGSLCKVNYRHDFSTQGIRNGLVFGDASLGPDYDLDIEVLGGARVEIDGKMLYDNAR